MKSLEIDVLGLGELHNKHLEEQYKEKRWMCSERSKITKQGEDPDPAAGVAILLSPRMADRILETRCVGARIACVLMEGPVCDLFIVVPHIPHKGRKKAPHAKDIIAQLRELLLFCCCCCYYFAVAADVSLLDWLCCFCYFATDTILLLLLIFGDTVILLLLMSCK